MNRQKALSIKNSLDAGSKKTLSNYCEQLRAEDNRVIFDDRVLQVMLKYAKDPNQIRSVRDWCNLTNYNQSTKEYQQLVSQLERFAQEDYTSFRWNRNYQEAKALLISQFSKANLKPLNYLCDQDLKDALPKKDTHSGWTYILSGKKRKGDNLEDIYNKFMIEQERAKSEGSFDKPILIGVRTQCGNVFNEDGSKIYDEFGKPKPAKHKTRLVSMIDLNMILAELIWAKPLQKFMGEHILWYAGGKSDTDLLYRITHLRSKFDNWISLDYSKYDQSISSWLMEDCAEIKAAAFGANIGDKKLLDIVERDSIDKVFIDGDGQLWEAESGVPSGLMCTNIDDTIINKLMITTCMLAFGKKPKDFDCLIMGDDNLLFVNGVNKKDVCSYLRKNFGIECNETKSSSGESSDNPEFLSRFWKISGPYRHPNILISKLLFPERFRDYDGKGFTPELVFFSYILAYYGGMNEAFNIKEFLNEHSLSITNEMVMRAREYLPGYLGYVYSYGLV